MPAFGLNRCWGTSATGCRPRPAVQQRFGTVGFARVALHDGHCIGRLLTVPLRNGLEMLQSGSVPCRSEKGIGEGGDAGRCKLRRVVRQRYG